MRRGRPKGKSTDKRSFGPLGDLIRKKRLERNLGLLDVAKAVKCSVQFISNIEHGRAPLPWDKAERLSTYLEIPMEDLQAANLSIRADYKSFMATSRGKRVAKANTVLGSVREVTGALAAQTGTDSQLSDFIKSVQALPMANRKRFYAEARKLLETL
ncbi:MAG: XRE family transcriptional regulator [Proteobacteria bacterium]|jgi:transcriptional regulator with XRE-family HTH domain|nr:XRE family transcriptional regulator [Pseudomonadota bacterium]